MGNLQKLFVGVAAVAFIAAWYFLNAPKPYKPCERPIEYSLGQVDPRIGVNRGDLLDDMRRATDIWNRAEGKTLFVYKATSALPVNFVYGSVQARRDRNRPLIEAIEANKTAIEALEEKTAPLRRAYLAQRGDIKRAEYSLQQDLSVFNANVERWNAAGGAPPDERAALDSEKVRLIAQKLVLTKRTNEFNSLVGRMNALVREHNDLVARSNGDVAIINRYAGQRYFAGMYRYWKDRDGNIVRNWIDVYEVADTASLVTLLAHEFGHALGLPHNDDPKSIMAPSGDVPSYEQTSAEQAKRPSAEDMAALNAICHPSGAK